VKALLAVVVFVAGCADVRDNSWPHRVRRVDAHPQALEEVSHRVHRWSVPRWARPLGRGVPVRQLGPGTVPESGGPVLGGNGGRVMAVVPVVPGQTVEVLVGQMPTTSTGGFGGGGSATFYDNAGSGGGRSEIKVSGVVVVVAGGGGGPSYFAAAGGAGGGLIGQAGAGPRPGGGGTQSAGGAGAGGGGTGVSGSGGAAGHLEWTAGGGGGGGFYGGGGGAGTGQSNKAAGGGGGGSSYTDPSATGVVHTQGYNTGNGQVTISW